MNKGNWRVFMEWRESGPSNSSSHDYRIELKVFKSSNDSKLKWKVTGEETQGGPRYFSSTNGRIPIPVGHWMKLYVYQKHHKTDGRIMVTLRAGTDQNPNPDDNPNQEIFDVSNIRTKFDSNWSIWNIFKCYTDAIEPDIGRVAYQYIDNVRIWGR